MPINYCSFTVCNIAYLHKAMSLAKSYKEYTGELINLYIFDKKREIPDYSNIANIIWIEDLNIDGFKELSFKYDVTELTTSLKPCLALKLLETNEKVIFFDPDVYICNKIDYIIGLLDQHPIVLTPHYTLPQESGTNLDQSDVGMLRFGSFNLGFFAISKDQEGLDFLAWWDKRCRDLCFFETQFGLSTDQKWITIAPCFFPNLHVVFNLGLNVSFWNMHERTMTYDEARGKYYVNDTFELVFFHFSSYNDKEPQLLTTRPFTIDISSSDALQNLINSYQETYQESKDSLIDVDEEYSFDFMSDGSYISPILRSAYAAIVEDIPEDHNPFDSEGIVGRFAKKNKLYMPKKLNHKNASVQNLEEHKVKFSIVIFLMRLILRFLGPLKFYNFSRLLVYLSSPRQVKDLWKL